MTFADDDLASFMIAPNREHTGYGQGVIVSFDVSTFENVVEYRGTRLTNLPVLSGPDALTYQPGDIVLLMRWTPSGKGVSSYWIAGRPVIPAAGRAEAVIEFMRGELAKQIAAEVFAERVASVADATSVVEPGGTYSLDGPALTDVEISDTGRCLVFLSARVFTQHFQPDGSFAVGFMSFEISGDSAVSPDDDQSLSVRATGPADVAEAIEVRATQVVLVEGLNAGLHNITAAYKHETDDGTVSFAGRTLSVIAF